MLTGISFDSLVEALEEVPPYTPESVHLLRHYRAEGTMPTSQEQSRAITEQIAYSRRCEALVNRVSELTPIPLILPEFSETFPL